MRNAEKIINDIVTYLSKKGVKEIGFFGSFARNEMVNDSDIDVLVAYNRGTTLFDIATMQAELNKITGRKVDLVDKEAVLPKVMEYIKKDIRMAYHA